VSSPRSLRFAFAFMLTASLGGSVCCGASRTSEAPATQAPAPEPGTPTEESVAPQSSDQRDESMEGEAAPAPAQAPKAESAPAGGAQPTIAKSAADELETALAEFDDAFAQKCRGAWLWDSRLRWLGRGRYTCGLEPSESRERRGHRCAQTDPTPGSEEGS
jgi:hypothetical protein